MDNQNGINIDMHNEEESVPMGFLQRIVGIFISPVKTMENIKEHPKYLAPLFVFFLAGIAMFFTMGPLTAITTEELSRICIERYGVDLTAMSTAVLGESTMQTITSLITAVVTVFTPYVTAFLSSLVLLIISKLTKGKATLKQYYSMYLHISIVTTLGGLLVTILCLLFKSSTNVLSLAVLMPGGNLTMFLYDILSGISVFSIWEAVLIFIGVKCFNEFSSTKAAVATVIMFVLGVIILAYSQYSAILSYDMIYNLQSSTLQ